MCLVAQSSEGASSFECEPWALANPLNASSPAAKPNSLVTIVYRNKRDSFKKKKTKKKQQTDTQLLDVQWCPGDTGS